MEITEKKGLWYTIVHEDYTAYAKVYPEPSKFGIDGGHVSKLLVTGGCGLEIFHYDRGLDFDHSAGPIVSEFVAFCEQMITHPVIAIINRIDDIYERILGNRL